MRKRSVLFIPVAVGLLAISIAGVGLFRATCGSPEAMAHASTAAASRSNLIFNGATIGSFLLNQSAPGAVHEVPDPAGSGKTVFEMTVNDNDVAPITPTNNPRAELQSPPRVHPGQQIWWNSKFYLPKSFPRSVPGWFTVLGGPYGPPFRGPAPWHIEVNRNHIQWPRNSTYNYDVPWQMPLVRGRWIRVLAHIKFSRHGYVEMWVNGHQIKFFSGGTYNPNHVRSSRRLHMATRDQANDGGDNFVSLLSYRERGMFNNVTIFQGPTKVGRTRASVRMSSGR